MDGSVPRAPLLSDAGGKLYGTTAYGGGPALVGTVFKLTPSGGGSYRESVLHRFGNPKDGATPLAGLLADSTGALLGTTEMGGTHGDGTVFKLTPSGSKYTSSILYSFAGGTDGASPTGGLIAVGSALFGTTSDGGTGPNRGNGTVFELAP
jgi:uncharacterized repeat protein (TIGR03803 family)